MKLWVNNYAPFLVSPAGKKQFDLNEKTIVIATGNEQEPYLEVKYGDKTGWMHTNVLEPYLENKPSNCVSILYQTPDPFDAEQYIVYNGARQVNMCGQLCVCYCMSAVLEDFLDCWKQEKPTGWKRIFGNTGKVAGGTDIGDLQSMFDVFMVDSMSLGIALHDGYLKRSRYTMSALKQLLEEGNVIASVTIKQGRLSGEGIGHWVVVTNVYPERAGYGFVDVYNPYFNRIESYSWKEFLASAKQPYGVHALKPKGMYNAI